MFSCLKSCICCEERIRKPTTNSETGNTERGGNTGNTEMVGNTQLSDDVIERLAVSIVAANMETIAISYMKIQSETLENLKITHRGNTTAFNRSVLTIWKCMNPGDNEVQRLANILSQAAADGGYVDPQKVHDILGVPSTSFVSDDTISEEEFLVIAEKLKPFAEQKMKIQPFPWFPSHLIDMDKLYTELTLEKVDSMLFGKERKGLERYEQMFNCHKSEHKNKKVLMKADPGMGKTTLRKKVTRDWATGVFKKFSMVFFVALKLVKPGDPIEKAIIQQNPELEGLQITQQKLKAVLNRYSSRILIILDGLDEHNLEQNEDVLKIIKNQLLLGCGIVVSSRPHSVNEVEQHFPTIIRVEGFTEKEASKFISKFFAGQEKIDQTKITQILQFKPSDSREDFPVHKCPILLSFLCLLVKEDEVNLSDRDIVIGDLYFRMVKCLYTKFTKRKGVTFEKKMFHQVLTSVGKLALQTLKSGNPLLAMEDIVGMAGEFAFEYGLFAGHEDLTPSTDPSPGICVTYAHRSLEEFFGSFGFLQALDDGKSVDDVLGSNCEEPVFMVNPLVFTFCLWLLTRKFFSSESVVYDKLVSYAAQQIDFHMINTYDIAKMYPAMNITAAIICQDRLKLEFFRHVFEKCEHVRHLWYKDEEVDHFLELITHNLWSKLTRLSLTDGNGSLPSVVSSDNFTISIGCDQFEFYHKVSKILLTNNDIIKRNPQVYAKIVSKEPHDLSTLLQKHIKKLNLNCNTHHWDDPKGTLSVSNELPSCPQFTHFKVYGLQINDSVPAAFMKAVKDRKFPNLRRIELRDCTMNDCEWPEVPEFSLPFLAPQMQKLVSNLTELTIGKKDKIGDLIKVRLEKLSVLELYDTNAHNLRRLNNVLKQGFLPNLSELALKEFFFCEMKGIDIFLHEFDPNSTSKMEKLELSGFVISADDLKILSEKLNSLQVTKLNLRGSRSFTGNLSVLLTHSLPTLNTLILYRCDLNSDDVQSLAEAKVKGKLPRLEHLDISKNDNVDISDLFAHSAQWDQLKTLKTSDTNVLNVDPEFLTSLEELHIIRVRRRTVRSITRRWPGLKVIRVFDEDIVRCIADGVERGMFPSLATVRRTTVDVPIALRFKLFRANISVEQDY